MQTDHLFKVIVVKAVDIDSADEEEEEDDEEDEEQDKDEKDVDDVTIYVINEQGHSPVS